MFYLKKLNESEEHFNVYSVHIFDFKITGNLNSNIEMVVKCNDNKSNKKDRNDSAKPIHPSDSNKEEWIENPIGENDIYMNEQFIPNIPVDQLDSFIAEKRSKGNDGFKKEYAV